MLKLINPSYKYKNSFTSAVSEYLKVGEMTKKEADAIIVDLQDPNVFIRRKSLLKKERIVKGNIPRSHFWLVDGKDYLGQLDIRHKLNKSWREYGGHIGSDIRPSKRGRGLGIIILKLGLKKAKKLGIHNVLVTCDKDNIRSKKVIEDNGGKLTDEKKINRNGKKITVLRFKILNK